MQFLKRTACLGIALIAIAVAAPRVAGATQKAAAPAPQDPTVVVAELEAEHQDALAAIDMGLQQQADPKRAKAARAEFDRAVKLMKNIADRAGTLTKAAVTAASAKEQAAHGKRQSVFVVVDPEAKRQAIADASAAQQEAIRDRVSAAMLENAASRLTDAIKEMEGAVKEGSADKIKSASAAFSFDLRRIVIALAPRTPQP